MNKGGCFHLEREPGAECRCWNVGSRRGSRARLVPTSGVRRGPEWLPVLLWPPVFSLWRGRGVGGVGGESQKLKKRKKFASDTHTPLGLLFLPEPPDEQVPIPDMRTIGDTGVARPSADLLDMIYLCQDRQEWYRAHALAHGFTPLDFAGSATTRNPPDVVADHIRSLLNLDVGDRAAFSKREEARRGLIERIEDLGVLVMVSGIVGASTRRVLRTEEFRGFALADPIAPLIFINGTDAK